MSLNFNELSVIDPSMTIPIDPFNENLSLLNLTDDINDEMNIVNHNNSLISLCKNKTEIKASKNHKESLTTKQNSQSLLTKIDLNNFDYVSSCISNNINSNMNEQSCSTNKKQKKKPIFIPHKKWSKEEDEKLKKLVEEFGVNDWRHLAKKMEGRNSRQCRERYQYYLNPSLIQGQWTREEDELIISLRNNLGPQWMKISKYFEHRTDAMIKNRYNLLVRNSIRQNRKKLSKSAKKKKIVEQPISPLSSTPLSPVPTTVFTDDLFENDFTCDDDIYHIVNNESLNDITNFDDFFLSYD